MKNVIYSFLVLMLVHTSCNAQSTDEQLIIDAIMTFSKAGDANDVSALEKVLDVNYRIVMNRLFGSNEVTVMPREVYLQKIKTGEYGGDTRQVKVESVLQNGTLATAKVTFVGKQMTFISLLELVKDDQNRWKLISDAPIVK